MSQREITENLYVSHTEMQFITGTWTSVANSGLSYRSKSAANETATVLIPFPEPRRSDTYGVKINSLKVHYRCATDAMDAAPVIGIYKQTLGATSAADTDNTTSALTTTDDGVVTADANDRLLTCTVTTPAYDDADTAFAYEAQLTLDAGTTSAIRVYGAEWNFTTRT